MEVRPGAWPHSTPHCNTHTGASNLPTVLASQEIVISQLYHKTFQGIRRLLRLDRVYSSYLRCYISFCLDETLDMSFTARCPEVSLCGGACSPELIIAAWRKWRNWIFLPFTFHCRIIVGNQFVKFKRRHLKQILCRSCSSFTNLSKKRERKNKKTRSKFNLQVRSQRSQDLQPSQYIQSSNLSDIHI